MPETTILRDDETERHDSESAVSPRKTVASIAETEVQAGQNPASRQ